MTQTVNKKGGRKLCVWSQAGIVHSMSCNVDYDCDHCDLDLKLKRARLSQTRGEITEGLINSSDSKIKYWKDSLRDRPISQRPCVHAMKGHIDFRTCTNDYHCVNCDFNQYFQDQLTVHAVINPVDTLDVNGFKIPQGYYFHRGHTWVKIESNDEARIGLDDFSFKVLGRADAIQTPLIGKTITQGKKEIDFIKGTNQARLTSPISGVVTAVNMDIRNNGTRHVKSPYTDGWLFLARADHLRSDLKQLLLGDEEKNRQKKAIKNLMEMIEQVDKPLAADGGEFAEDLISKMPELGWDRVVTAFF